MRLLKRHSKHSGSSHLQSGILVVVGGYPQGDPPFAAYDAWWMTLRTAAAPYGASNCKYAVIAGAVVRHVPIGGRSDHIADQRGIPEPEQVTQYQQTIGRSIDSAIAVDIQRSTQ